MASINQNAYSSALPNFRNLGILLRILLLVNIVAFAAAVVKSATLGGIPVSTTHTISGAIVGVGSARRTRDVRWGVALNLVVAWVLSIPASGLIAAIFWWLGTQFL